MGNNQKLVRTVGIATTVISVMVFISFCIALSGTKNQSSGYTLEMAMHENQSTSNMPLIDSQFDSEKPKESYISSGTALAPESIDDLQSWYDAVGVQGVGGEERAHSFDKPGNQAVRERLLLSGKIIQTANQSRVNVLSTKGQTIFVELLDGIDKGKRGNILKGDIWNPSSPPQNYESGPNLKDDASPGLVK